MAETYSFSDEEDEPAIDMAMFATEEIEEAFGASLRLGDHTHTSHHSRTGASKPELRTFLGVGDSIDTSHAPVRPFAAPKPVPKPKSTAAVPYDPFASHWDTVVTTPPPPSTPTSRTSPRDPSTPKTSMSSKKSHVSSKSLDSSASDPPELISKRRLLTPEEMKARTEVRRNEIRGVLPLIRQAQELDMCFVVDCTGSMDPHIEAVKTQINAICDRARTVNGNSPIRVAFVRYTDFDVGATAVTSFDFSENIESFKRFVSEIRAGGGGDSAEDVMSGLIEVSRLAWKPHTTKIMILIADAPCHGKEYHDGCMDDRAETTSPDSHVDPLRALAQAGVLLHFGRISSLTDKMIRVFNSFLAASFPHRPLISTFDLSKPENLFEGVKDSVETSIMTSIASVASAASGVSTASTIRSYSLTSDTPDTIWATPSLYHSANWISTQFIMPFNHHTVEKPEFELDRKSTTIRMEWSKHPFADGGVRVAYHAKIDKHNSQMVLKMFRSIRPGANSIKNYFLEAETQTIAAYFANGFNHQVQKHKLKGVPEFKFLKARVVQLKRRDETTVTGFMERFVEGDFVKFNNNTGVFKTDSELSEHAQALSHYSWVTSGRNHLLVDVQGWVMGDKVLLTDPAIHSKNILKFGKTNLGMKGKDQFFASHICGRVCKTLDLDSTVN